MRNAFMQGEDNNIPEEVKPYLENGPYMLLPRLNAGFSYKLIKLEDGRTAVVIEDMRYPKLQFRDPADRYRSDK